MAFLYHDALPFATKKPLLPLPPEKPLDHESGQCRPESRPFKDLKFHGSSYIFLSLV